jgi:hypothetical protein
MWAFQADVFDSRWLQHSDLVIEVAHHVDPEKIPCFYSLYWVILGEAVVLDSVHVVSSSWPFPESSVSWNYLMEVVETIGWANPAAAIRSLVEPNSYQVLRQKPGRMVTETVNSRSFLSYF